MKTRHTVEIINDDNDCSWTLEIGGRPIARIYDVYGDLDNSANAFKALLDNVNNHVFESSVNDY